MLSSRPGWDHWNSLWVAMDDHPHGTGRFKYVPTSPTRTWTLFLLAFCTSLKLTSFNRLPDPYRWNNIFEQIFHSELTLGTEGKLQLWVPLTMYSVLHALNTTSASCCMLYSVLHGDSEICWFTLDSLIPCYPILPIYLPPLALCHHISPWEWTLALFSQTQPGGVKWNGSIEIIQV